MIFTGFFAQMCAHVRFVNEIYCYLYFYIYLY